MNSQKINPRKIFRIKKYNEINTLSFRKII